MHKEVTLLRARQILAWLDAKHITFEQLLTIWRVYDLGTGAERLGVTDFLAKTFRRRNIS